MTKVADKSTVTCLDKEFDVFLTSTEIQDRIKTLAERIAKDYEGQKPVLLGILNGCFRFVADLFNYLDIECEVSFVKLKSYVGTQSGEMKMMLGLDTSLEGRPVIVLEDIVDTGKTMHTFLPELKSHKPSSIAIATLLVKPDAAKYDIPLEYVGFSVPNHFLLGYGLDYDGFGRQHNAIYKIIE